MPTPPWWMTAAARGKSHECGKDSEIDMARHHPLGQCRLIELSPTARWISRRRPSLAAASVCRATTRATSCTGSC